MFSDPLIVSPVFSLLSGGKSDKVALSFVASASDCIGLLLSGVGMGGTVCTGDCFTRGERKVSSKNQ